jgi:hypothetical protein
MKIGKHYESCATQLCFEAGEEHLLLLVHPDGRSVEVAVILEAPGSMRIDMDMPASGRVSTGGGTMRLNYNMPPRAHEKGGARPTMKLGMGLCV